MKVCLDTNVLVAAFATRGLCADVLRTCLTEHELVVGEVHLIELRRVLKSKFKLPDDKIAAVEGVFANLEAIPKPAKAPQVSIRDDSDRWILATAIAGGAEVLVTGDDDLLSIAIESPVKILTPRSFWEFLTR